MPCLCYCMNTFDDSYVIEVNVFPAFPVEDKLEQKLKDYLKQSSMCHYRLQELEDYKPEQKLKTLLKLKNSHSSEESQKTNLQTIYYRVAIENNMQLWTFRFRGLPPHQIALPQVVTGRRASHSGVPVEVDQWLGKISSAVIDWTQFRYRNPHKCSMHIVESTVTVDINMPVENDRNEYKCPGSKNSTGSNSNEVIIKNFTDHLSDLLATSRDCLLTVGVHDKRFRCGCVMDDEYSSDIIALALSNHLNSYFPAISERECTFTVSTVCTDMYAHVDNGKAYPTLADAVKRMIQLSGQCQIFSGENGQYYVGTPTCSAVEVKRHVFELHCKNSNTQFGPFLSHKCVVLASHITSSNALDVYMKVRSQLSPYVEDQLRNCLNHVICVHSVSLPLPSFLRQIRFDAEWVLEQKSEHLTTVHSPVVMVVVVSDEAGCVLADQAVRSMCTGSEVKLLVVALNGEIARELLRLIIDVRGVRVLDVISSVYPPQIRIATVPVSLAGRVLVITDMPPSCVTTELVSTYLDGCQLAVAVPPHCCAL